ncbi:GNAT family N-acetyltransferase [Mesorhizobium sp. CGMCC 1.15528]|uniref:GNAT family N-acetyltransferase n=1 Tax=Mesorhizobium zhangyense TaxID=1776730 RepID=A0A7C9VEP5_9HYPH|nr:GNAT family N-acetyltransferase [Mesorhizobium zhangyense]NGN43509.1 GNAT family N-acetyltransferase [Mesorhizobium zhangyense]
MNIVLRPLKLSDWHLVASIELDAEQERFAGGDMDAIFLALQTSNFSEALHPFAIVADADVVGFYVLREGPALPAWASKDAVTLHSFRVSRSQQGKGYGTVGLKLAARWIAANRPEIQQLMLTVNADNPDASALYLHCGFRATGVIFKGRIGQERVLACEIDALSRHSGQPE